MPLHQTRRCAPPAKRYQGGITTLAITLILLVILTVMALFSANVGFFEQRTTTNENRAQLTESLAEYALNLGGEYLKSSRVNIISKTGSGWLVTTGTGRGWVRCPSAAVAPPPGGAGRDPPRPAAGFLLDK
jgi:Tfp pilus assembly protein PilX